MKHWIKVTLSLCVSIVVLISFIALYSYVLLHSPLPEYSGELTVQGISGEVKIYRDQHAVPYIIALREEDAAFGLGFVHAQERLFQMDFLRRIGTGRLSEVFGSKTLPIDKMFRTLDFSSVVDKSFKAMNPLAKNILLSYTAGINQYIKDAKGDYPTEFDVLGYDPDLWKPEHSLIISKLMAWQLNLSWWSDISFAHLMQKLGAYKVADILPDYPENEPTIIPENYRNIAQIPTGLIEVDKMFREFIGFTGTHIGSNNWVVNGDHSESGKPIIANDPHLPLSSPATWYVAVIRAGNWSCEGFTLPGAPGIVIGKNENISWVTTNVMADDADFYIERLDSTKTKYMLDGSWKNLNIKLDTIFVKDSAFVELEIKRTHRGPIISDIHSYNSLFPNEHQNEVDISMRWTGFDISDELFAMYLVNRAANWNEYKEGLRQFHSPGQNFVYADKEGNIGYVCAAKLPNRRHGSPTLIFNGTTSRYDWIGYVPYNEMPKLFNPAQGYIASANNKTVKDFRYHISNIWEPPSRIQRITELISQKRKHSINDFKNYQNDFYSHFAEDLTPYILNAFKDINVEEENLKLSLTLLKKWDFIMDQQSQVPTIYGMFFQKLMRNIFLDEMGEVLLNEYIYLANVPYRTILRLLKNRNSIWFDDITTDKRERRNDIIRKSLIDALDELAKLLGPDSALWQWGEIHKVTFRHTFHGVSSIIDPLIDIGPFSMGGDGTTIFMGEYSFTKPFNVRVGPSMRYIFDFAKPDEFQYILTTGQSGHFLSDHYKGMAEQWLKGGYITVNTNLEFVEESDYDLLLLQPE
ncbi:penicillin acylase family protein [Bacteroidota bacterium]